MAIHDTTASALTKEVFEMAEIRAKSSADQRAIETEHQLEILYQIRLARRRARAFAGTSNAIVLRMAGWE